MSTEHDDLEAFADSPLVRALRAPGTPAELADEARFVAAYRRALPGSARGRVLGRIGVGGAALLAAVTLTGGVAAAAYTQRLPHPVQSIAHDAFGGVGVPPARPRSPEPPRAEPTPADGASAGRTPDDRRTTGAPRAGGSDDPATTPETGTTEATPSTSAPASGAPVPAPTKPTGGASPTSPGGGVTTGPQPAPTSVAVTVSARRVTTGGHASVTATVLDDGDPVAGAEVSLLRRHADGRWTRMSGAVTGSTGTAVFATGTLVETTFFRARVEVGADADNHADDHTDTDNASAADHASTRPLLSRKRRIGVQPLLSLSSDGPVLWAQAVGARTGDAVTVSRRRADGSLVRVGIRRLDDAGRASYDLSPYAGRLRLQVRVLRTTTHTAVTRWITVRIPREPKPSPTPTPSPSPSAGPSGSAGSSTTSGS